MSVFVQIDDFKNGRFALALGVQSKLDLQSIIDKHELKTIKRIFGIELGQLVYDNPTSYLDYTDPFELEYCGKLYDSEGLTEMLKGIVYFYYVRNLYTTVNVGGVSRNLGENSDNLDTNSHDLWSRYNSSIDMGKAIQYRLLLDNQPDFDGYELNYILPL